MSIVFDARKDAERSKRARDAAAGTVRLPDTQSQSSDLSEPHIDFSSNSDKSTSAHLGLRAERHAREWFVKWNRSAAATAVRGRLLITDGGIHKELELAANELRSGNIIYSPLTDDVVLRLEVAGADSHSSISDSVRLVAGATSSLPGQPEITSGNRRGGVRTARSNGAWTPDITSGATSRESAVVRSLLRQTRSDQLSSDIGALGAVQRGEVEPAKLILSSHPVYPALAEQRLASQSLEVRFRISPDGKVYGAKLVKGSPVLAQAAIEAVETWCYEPARLNGVPVDSQGCTTFDFTVN